MADIAVDTSVISNLYAFAVRAGPVWLDTNTGYIFFIDSSSNLKYRKTSDAGATWASAITVLTGTVGTMSVWYDRWTPGNTGRYIHLVYTDSAASIVYYTRLDTLDDSLSTVVVFIGSSYSGSWSDAVADIVRSRGGNLYLAFWGNASGGQGFYRSTDNGVTWASRTDLADGDAVDAILLMPGTETDAQDIWCIYWDRSADELSLKVYDNSGDSWSETSIATSIVDTITYYQMSAAPRHSDHHVILAAWNAIDASTADLRVWDIGGATNIIAKANVVTDLGESAQVAVLIDQQTEDIYVAYIKGGTWEATVDVVYRKSTDGGVTWGSETAYSEASADDIRALWAGVSVGTGGGHFQPTFFNDDLDDLFVNLVNDVNFAAYSTSEVLRGPRRGFASLE